MTTLAEMFRSAAIRLRNGKTYEGQAHVHAFINAKRDGHTWSGHLRFADEGFVTHDGVFLTRKQVDDMGFPAESGELARMGMLSRKGRGTMKVNENLGIKRALRTGSPEKISKSILRQGVRVGKEWSTQETLPLKSLKYAGMLATANRAAPKLYGAIGQDKARGLFSLGVKKGYEAGPDTRPLFKTKPLQYANPAKIKRLGEMLRADRSLRHAISEVLAPAVLQARAEATPINDYRGASKKADLLFRSVSRTKRLAALKARIDAARMQATHYQPGLRPNRDPVWEGV